MNDRVLVYRGSRPVLIKVAWLCACDGRRAALRDEVAEFAFRIVVLAGRLGLECLAPKIHVSNTYVPVYNNNPVIADRFLFR